VSRCVFSLVLILLAFTACNKNNSDTFYTCHPFDSLSLSVEFDFDTWQFIEVYHTTTGEEMLQASAEFLEMIGHWESNHLHFITYSFLLNLINVFVLHFADGN